MTSERRAQARRQQEARGFPVRFIQRPEQLDALKAELLRMACDGH